MLKDHRKETRDALALPVATADGAQGVTRDISASGLYFVTDREQTVGGQIDLQIELQTENGPVRLVAQGRIVRIQTEGSRTGVAVELLQSRLVADDPPGKLQGRQNA